MAVAAASSSTEISEAVLLSADEIVKRQAQVKSRHRGVNKTADDAIDLLHFELDKLRAWQSRLLESDAAGSDVQIDAVKAGAVPDPEAAPSWGPGAEAAASAADVASEDSDISHSDTDYEQSSEDDREMN